MASENVGHLGRGRCCDCDGVLIEEVQDILTGLAHSLSLYVCILTFIVDLSESSDAACKDV